MSRNGHSKGAKRTSLAVARERKGLTQEQAAEVLQITRSTVARLESLRSDRLPSHALCERIGAFVGEPWWRVREEYVRLRGAR